MKINHWPERAICRQQNQDIVETGRQLSGIYAKADHARRAGSYILELGGRCYCNILRISLVHMECAPSEILQAEIRGQYFTFSCCPKIACAVIENRLGSVVSLLVGPIRKILRSECPHRNRLRLHPVHHRRRVIIILAPFLPV